MAKKRVDSTPKIGFWHMLRDVLVASLNKGQFPIALVGLALIILVSKLESGDASKLVFRIFDGIEKCYLVGYVLSVFLGIGWFIHAKIQRRMITSEMKRVSEERNRLQANRIGKSLPSSEE